MTITSATFAYPRLGGRARAAVAVAIGRTPPLAGVFVLSTCLRVEVAAEGDETSLRGCLVDLLPSVDHQPEIRSGVDAARYLFRVAAGLESPIVGEVEVLSQFRAALAAMKRGGGVDGRFSKLLEKAVAAGRAVRRAAPSPYSTMADVAAGLVAGHPRVAVIGSGAMATAVCGALVALGASPTVTKLVRSPDRVTGVDVRGMESLPEILESHPAVVSATAASTRLISGRELAAALAKRTEPLLLVDMSMPPDFGPRPGSNLAYVGIDDLAEMARGRTSGDGAADGVAAAAADAYHQYLAPHEPGPVIASIIARADAIVDETVARFAPRLSDQADREVLAQAARTVARTIIDRPVSAVRSSRDAVLVEAIATVFDHG